MGRLRQREGVVFRAALESEYTHRHCAFFDAIQRRLHGGAARNQGSSRHSIAVIGDGAMSADGL